MKQIILCVALGLGLLSCEKTLELDADTKTSKLVVNSLFSDQDSWKVDVSRSLSVLDGGNLTTIDDATVSIFNGTTLVSNLIYDGEKYVILGLSASPIAGIEYKVEVSAPNYTAVSAKDFCPNRVPILSVDTSSVINIYGDKEYTATINFQDQPNADNYYGIEIEVLNYSRNYNPSTALYDTTFNGTDKTDLSSIDPVIDNVGSGSYSQTLTLKDNLFDGQQKAISVNYTIYELGPPNQFTVKKIKLISFTKSSYNYSKSIEAYRVTEGNPFAEPVQVFSNVENGFGIFGGQSTSEFDF